MKTIIETLFNQNNKIAHMFALSESIVVYPGDCLDLLMSIPGQIGH